MTDGHQYLRLSLQHMDYLLPSEASISIEQRDHLQPADADDGAVSAWRDTHNQRWPAFYLDGGLMPAQSDAWQRAIFIDGLPHPLGLIADEIQLLPRAEVHIEPFTPLGPPPSPAGPVFAGAWIRNSELVMVLDPKGLIGYLTRIWKG